MYEHQRFGTIGDRSNFQGNRNHHDNYMTIDPGAILPSQSPPPLPPRTSSSLSAIGQRHRQRPGLEGVFNPGFEDLEILHDGRDTKVYNENKRSMFYFPNDMMSPCDDDPDDVFPGRYDSRPSTEMAGISKRKTNPCNEKGHFDNTSFHRKTSPTTRDLSHFCTLPRRRSKMEKEHNAKLSKLNSVEPSAMSTYNADNARKTQRNYVPWTSLTLEKQYRSAEKNKGMKRAATQLQLELNELKLRQGIEASHSDRLRYLVDQSFHQGGYQSLGRSSVNPVVYDEDHSPNYLHRLPMWSSQLDSDAEGLDRDRFPHWKQSDQIVLRESRPLYKRLSLNRRSKSEDELDTLCNDINYRDLNRNRKHVPYQYGYPDTYTLREECSVNDHHILPPLRISKSESGPDLKQSENNVESLYREKFPYPECIGTNRESNKHRKFLHRRSKSEGGFRDLFNQNEPYPEVDDNVFFKDNHFHQQNEWKEWMDLPNVHVPTLRRNVHTDSDLLCPLGDLTHVNQTGAQGEQSKTNGALRDGMSHLDDGTSSRQRRKRLGVRMNEHQNHQGIQMIFQVSRDSQITEMDGSVFENFTNVKSVNISHDSEKYKQDKDVVLLKAERLSSKPIGKRNFSRKGPKKKELKREETLVQQKLRRERKPFIYCRLVANYPKTSFFVTLSGHLLLALVTLVLVASGYDLFPTEFEKLPMEIREEPSRLRDLAWRFRNEYPHLYTRKLYAETLPTWYRATSYGRANIDLYYDTGDENIFTKKNLELIQKLEDDIVSLKDFKHFCQMDKSRNCSKPMSIIRFFDGTLFHIDPVFYDPDFDNIPKVIYAAKTNNITNGEFQFFLAKSYTVSKNEAVSHMTRSMIHFGYPMEDVKSKVEMEDKMKEFLVNSVKPKLEYYKSSIKEFELVYWSYLLFLKDVVIQAISDMLWTIASVIFIFCFMIYHTKSLWISTWAVLSIVTSFLGTNLFYRIALDFQYFGYFHILSMFIILGIGADDLFVFYDVWRNTAYHEYPTLAHRLSDAYTKSVFSMFVTSITTTVAFFVSGMSPLLATKSFGIFSGILVVVNYISVIVFFPTVVTMYHIYFESLSWPCCVVLKGVFEHACCTGGDVEQFDKMSEVNTDTLKRKLDNSISTSTETQNGTLPAISVEPKRASSTSGCYAYANPNIATICTDETLGGDRSYHEIGIINTIANGKVSNRANDTNMSSASGTKFNYDLIDIDAGAEGVNAIETNPPQQRKMSIQPKSKPKKILVRFFRDYYFKFVTHRIIRWIILVFLFGVVIGFAFSATKLLPDNEQVQIYRSSHNYGKAVNYDLYSFTASEVDHNVVVYIVWGISPRDLSQCHFSAPTCYGEEKYDPEFNPNTVEAQEALLNFCGKLHHLSRKQAKDFKIQKDFQTGNPQIYCFIEKVQKYLQEKESNWTLPMNYNSTLEFMSEKQKYYSTRPFNRSFEGLLEIPISYWLNDGYSFRLTEDFATYNHIIGEEFSTFSTPVKTDPREFYGNKIRYFGIQVNLTLNALSTGYGVGLPTMELWEKFVKEEIEKMPAGMKNGFQLTRNTWHWMIVQKTLANNAILGIALGVALALPILTLATRNVIVGFFATFSMCCSTICVIGVIPLAGWKLGILVSLNMCMLVGLSVDYVVHLAEGYHMSLHRDRLSRVQDMLEEMGISVFSGACTTLGASVFMFFAQIQFFMQFGVFMFSTIGFSLLFSLGLFTTLMGILGPSNDTGDIVVLSRRICNWFRSRRRNNVNLET